MITNPQIPGTDRNSVIAQFEALKAESLRVEAEKRRAEKVEQLLQKIPLYYRYKTLDDFTVDCLEQGNVKRIVERYMLTFQNCLQEGSGLIFLGKYGTGKTMLSLIIYQTLAKRNVTVGYEPSLRFLRLLQEKNFESFASFQSSLNYYLHHSLLIIDEVTEGFAGKGGDLSDWERKMLFTLVDARYQSNLCTLVISNRNRQELIARLGEPLVDRLFQKNVTLAFNWHSYRQRENNAKTI